MILGSIVTAFIFGNMAALMAIINKKDSHFQEELEMVSQTMRSLKLPEEMQDNVLKYLQYIHETPDVQQDLDKFLALLSPALQNQIFYHLHSKVISQVEILKQCSSIEISYIVNHLKTLLFLPDDIIISQDEDSFHLYFINRGIVNISIVKMSIDREFCKQHIAKFKKQYLNQDDDESGQSQKMAAERSCCDPDSKAQASEGIINMFKDQPGEESATNLKESVDK